ncbi:MAG: asparagine synthase (glutamine-hydrolyzing) [Planctomycetota bacterium]|nr:MAG: asparagine synthase (glutamine-hydrolyzing) [Planctomycetota bacterium]
MCGICGYIGIKDKALIERMTDSLAHRGPDGRGVYVDKSGAAALGHARLSIIDVEGGAQPIANEDKSVHIIVNGEIYNHLDIRRKLESKGHRFTTRSDSETILHAYEEYGTECVKRLNGMFAFAVYDSKNRRLFAARDRLGIKPFYYSSGNGTFAFASEIKALRLIPGFNSELDLDAVDAYLTFRYIPGEMTMYRSVRKLLPGHSLVVENGRVTVNRYWDFDTAERRDRSESALLEEFRALVSDSVRIRLMSDVPLGAFLSGGVDSGCVVGHMAQAMGRPVETFTIDFGTDIDETERARRFAQHFKSNHHELTVGAQSFDLLPKILGHLDDPLGDAIIIPIYLLARETAKNVKVVLTGEGGDEILNGYIHHFALYYADYLKRLAPKEVRRMAPAIVRALPTSFWNVFFRYPADLGQQGKEKLAHLLSVLDDPAEAYLTLASLFSEDEKKEAYDSKFFESTQNGRAAFKDRLRGLLTPSENESFLGRLTKYDLANWLPDNILFKQDKLTMGSGLEARVPYLDHRIVEFCARLPAKAKFRLMTDKLLLRRAAEPMLPGNTAYTPKHAFYIPVEKVFKDDFDSYVKDIFASPKCVEKGILDADYVEKLRNAPRSKELLENKRLMAVLLLELWFKNN